MIPSEYRAARKAKAGDDLPGMDLFISGSCCETIGPFNRTIGESEFVENASLWGTGRCGSLNRFSMQ